MLLYLPLAHNYGRLVHLSAAYVGYTVAFLPDPLRVAEVLPLVRPTLFPSVPRVYEKIHAAVIAGFDEQTGAQRRIAEWALAVGRDVSKHRQAKRSLSPLLRIKFALADRLVFSKVKTRLGGRIRVANSGGAPLPRDVAEFFHAIDILILEGYGLSEVTTAATVNQINDYKFGTVGKALPGVELHIADDGEILIRSNTVFAGYYHDEEATRATIDDEGFVHTGDVGHIDDDGFLVITDRKKDIIVTAGGKNIAPQNLENDLKAHRIVSQAVVVGDRKPYIAALITTDPEVTRALDADAVQQAVQNAVDDVNRERSRYEQIKRFTVLPREFSLERDEVTPTLKLRRKVILEHFAEDVEKLLQLKNSAGADVRRRVPAGEEIRDLHERAGVRRFDELAVADVHPDVAEPVEEEDVARLELVLRHRHAVVPHRVRRVRQRHADLRVRPHHEPGAVERDAGRRAAPDVLDAELAHREARRRPGSATAVR